MVCLLSRTLHIIYKASICLCSWVTTLVYALYSGVTIDYGQCLRLDNVVPGHSLLPSPLLVHKLTAPGHPPLSLPNPTHSIYSYAQWALPSKHLPHLKFNNYLCNYFLMPTFPPDSKVHENRKLSDCFAHCSSAVTQRHSKGTVSKVPTKKFQGTRVRAVWKQSVLWLK